MPFDDARDVSEIRADGDEMSLVQNYNFNEAALSEPGMPDERSVLADHPDAPEEDEYAEDDRSDHEDGGDDHVTYTFVPPEEEQPAEPFVIGGLEFPSQAAAEEWAENWQAQQQGRQLDPTQAVLGVIDARVGDSFAQLQQAQSYAEQGRADRAAELGRRAELEMQSNYETALPEVRAICESVGLEAAVPPDWVLGRAEEIAEQMSAQALEQGMGSATEIGAAIADNREFAEAVVRQAAEEYRDKLVSERALSRL